MRAFFNQDTELASSPRPSPSFFSMLHFSACSVEKLGVSLGNEANTDHGPSYRKKNIKRHEVYKPP